MSAASYDPRAGVGGLPAEIDRLDLQAALGWPEERRLLREFGLVDGMRVVDVGCGPGALSARLAEAFPSCELLGVDPDPDLLEAARRRVPSASFLAGTAESLPLPDDSVDMAVARLVLQHLPDPVAAAREVRRVLVPGGRFVVIDVDGGLWGVASPLDPGLAAIQAKAWTAQRRHGGDRMIGRRLARILAAAGFSDPALRLYSYSSDDAGMDAIAPLIDPVSLGPLVEDGVVSPQEWAVATGIHRRFVADPDAYVLLVGFAAAGTA